MIDQRSPAPVAYDVVPGWEKPAAYTRHADVSAVGVDSKDHVYLLTRHESKVLVYDADGAFIAAWDPVGFSNPHGLTVGPDDAVWCVDNGNHTVHKFSPDGTPQMILGRRGVASDTGYDPSKPFTIHSVETVARAGAPFNGCTNVAIAADGHIYVADGYGNCCVHHFDSEGTLLRSWGGVGAGPGEFRLPHGIAIDADDRILICDRENDRIQIFDRRGNYLDQWNNVQRPDDLAIDADGNVFVAELWRPRGKGSFVHGIMKEDHPGRVSVLDRYGSVVARWGASTASRGAPGNFIAPHGIALDSKGAVYVAEVTYTFGIRPGLVSSEFSQHQIQKFQQVP